jgi:hypothetical protein
MCIQEVSLIRRSRVKWLTTWVLLACAVGCALAITWPRDRLLLRRSILIAHDTDFDNYDWDTNRSVLLFKNQYEDKTASLYHVDVSTNRRTPEPALAKRIGESGHRIWQFETSPDGQWLLWTTQENDGRYLYTGRSRGWLTNLKTGALNHFDIRGNSFADDTLPNELFWTPDSQNIVEFGFPEQILIDPRRKRSVEPTIVRCVNTPQRSIKLKPPPNWRLGSYAEIRVLSDQQIVAATSRDYDVINNGHPTLVKAGISVDASPASRAPLALPYGTQEMREIAFSPRGDRFAVAAVVDSHPAWLDAVHHWIPAIRGSPHVQVGIWLITVDGAHIDEIGHVSPEPSKVPILGPYVLPSELRWSPDGRHLGFDYKGALYSVPTD